MQHPSFGAARLVRAIACALCLAAAGAAQAADEMTPRQHAILKAVINVDGHITRELHAEFWSEAPRAIKEDPKAREAYLATIDRIATPGVRVQREGWASVKASLEARRVVRTPGYEAARRDFREAVANPEFRRIAEAALEKAERMMRAAAEGTPYQGPDGPVYITPELVEKVLGGLDGSIARYRMLMNPEWEPQAREHRYPEAHVAILSDEPFTVERRTVTTAERRTGRVVTLTRLSEAGLQSVSFMALGGVWGDPDGAVVRAAQGALRGAGVKEMRVHSTPWRGRRSAVGSGSATTSDGVAHASVRAVELREREGAMVFMAVSLESKADASVMRKDLEMSTQLLLD